MDSISIIPLRKGGLPFLLCLWLHCGYKRIDARGAPHYNIRGMLCKIRGVRLASRNFTHQSPNGITARLPAHFRFASMIAIPMSRPKVPGGSLPSPGSEDKPVNAPLKKGAKRKAVLSVDGVDNLFFMLGDAYPNPFFSLATLPFTMAYKAQVTLELLNVREEVQHTYFRNKELQAGSHRVLIDKESLGLTSGNYFAQITFRTITTYSTQRVALVVR